MTATPQSSPGRRAADGAEDGSRCDDCGGRPAAQEEGDMRCACGSLLARLVRGGVEVKCRRCKRTTILPIEAGTEM